MVETQIETVLREMRAAIALSKKAYVNALVAKKQAIMSSSPSTIVEKADLEVEIARLHGELELYVPMLRTLTAINQSTDKGYRQKYLKHFNAFLVKLTNSNHEFTKYGKKPFSYAIKVLVPTGDHYTTWVAKTGKELLVGIGAQQQKVEKAQTASVQEFQKAHKAFMGSLTDSQKQLFEHLRQCGKKAKITSINFN